MCVNGFSCEMGSQPRAGFFKLPRREGGRKSWGGREGRERRQPGWGAHGPLLCTTLLIHTAVGIDALFEVNCMPVHHSMKVKT